MSDRPSVHAVVLNWRQPDDTVACVRSLESSGYPGLGIIIVDNGSGDGSVETFRAAFPRHEVISLESNGGYARGNNEGIRHALRRGAEYVLIVNNDVVAEPGFLEPMVRIAEAEERVGVVTCKAYFSDGSGRIYCTGGHLSRLRCSGAPLSQAETGRIMPVEYVSGCVLLVKRRVFEDAGLIDETFFMYYEDFEFSRRVGKKFTMMYTPEGVVHHRSGGGSGWSNYTARYLYYNTRNRLLAFRGDGPPGRIYAAAYSVALACLKSCYLLVPGTLRPGDAEPVTGRIAAIWKGLFDGLLLKSSGPRARCTTE